MSEAVKERLYGLLPAVHRIRDAEQGEPLRALLAVIETELAALETDIGDLYENWFVETCEEWVVPYIGDLLGVRLLHAVQSAGIYTLRPYVANTLAYRRRKGTAFVLEQLARDVTGWPARAVEFFQLLCTTQHLNHLRPANLCPLDLRDPNPLELIDGPFDRAAHTGDVRHIDNGRGRHNIPNVGLFLWRLQAYPVERGTARLIGTPADARYTFSPLGYRTPLFNQPQTETEISHLAEEINAPGVLRRRALHDELEAWRQALVDGEPPQKAYFGTEPVFEVFVDGAEDPIPAEQVLICDLDDWRRPDGTKTYFPSSDPHCFETPGCGVERDIAVAVDPKLGRLTFPEGAEPSAVQVCYSYGFSGDVGGGPYDRQDSVRGWFDPLDYLEVWQIGVTKDQATLADAPDPGQLVTTLHEAVEAWNDQLANNPRTLGLITIMDSSTYQEDLTASHQVELPPGSKLAIVAADWPAVDVPDVPGQKQRVVGQLSPDGVRPHLLGDISAHGTSNGDADPGQLVLDGLMVEGTLTVLAGNLGGLSLHHCTLVPKEGGLAVASSTAAGSKNDRLEVRVRRSICDTIALPSTVPDLYVSDSIVGVTAGVAIEARGTDVHIEASTLFGRTRVRSLEASNTIFTERVRATRRQVGCVRFSYVAQDSRTPRRYRCQPCLALEQYAHEIGKASADELTAAQRRLVQARVKPRFASIHHDRPEYAQLSLACAEEIRTGAEDGAEMGVFHHLKQPQREANLRAALDEYLRFGLEAGLFYVT